MHRRCFNCDERPATVVYESSTAELPVVVLCGWCARTWPVAYGGYVKRGPKPRPEMPPAHGGYPGTVVAA